MTMGKGEHAVLPQSYKSLLKHNKNTPRYTSYPTAPHFREIAELLSTGEPSYEEWLQKLDTQQPLSLYVHVPFCKKICWYCGCHTKATNKYSPVEQYLTYLKREISLVAKTIQNKHQTAPIVGHIHFGGGSPSYLSATDFNALMQHIKTCFSISPSAEIAIELDPREINEAKVASYKINGVNRVSLGVQDFHPNVQKAINRYQPFHTVYESLKLLKQYSIQSCNIDLLYGLPLQTPEMIAENIILATALQPNRISLFGYAHVPWMKKHMRLIDEATMADAEGRLEQFSVAQAALTQKGYRQIGLDHFVAENDPMAKAYDTGTLKRNFQGYSTDTATTLIGFGPSAISSLPATYAQNTPDNRLYYKMLDDGALPVAKQVALTEDDIVRRGIIEHIMCYGIYNLSLHSAKFSASKKALAHTAFINAETQLEQLAIDNLITFSKEQQTLRVLIPQASRLAAAAFDAYLAPNVAQHTQVA